MEQDIRNRQIIGKSRTVRELLSGKKYTIDYYQREFKWGEKQIIELINDLVNAFYQYFDQEHTRTEVANYGYYFLGSIILSSKNGQNYIIDGQQRLTSLTLLLIFLNNFQKNYEYKVKIDDLIYSEKFGEKSFNMNIEERTDCMKSLYEKGTYDNPDDTESIQNIAIGYDVIQEAFPLEIEISTLPFFIDWLIENVVMVEIMAYSDQDAYRVFETMNDRGLSLTPTEMLKGHLLSNIRDETKKNDCNKIWKDRVQKLIEIEKDEDSDCIKAWLRGQYARNIRERKAGAQPQDFDLIGTEFHRWVRDNQDFLTLNHSDDFFKFIQTNFKFFSDKYLLIKKASQNFEETFKHIYFIKQTGFTLYYPVLLAPLTIDDNDELVHKKIEMTSIFLDILLHQRIWNFRSIDYNTMSYYIFNLMKGIRNSSLPELSIYLINKLSEITENFNNSREKFALRNMYKKYIKNILARFISYIEENCGQPSHYLEYMNPKNKFEIEHIWADHWERHQNEFDSVQDFDQYRNLIGGLLLLPKSFNASYGDLDYEIKLPHYYEQNILAQSLNKSKYEHNSRFLSFIENTQLAFKPYDEFKKTQLLERQSLYVEIAKKIWNPELIKSLVN